MQQTIIEGANIYKIAAVWSGGHMGRSPVKLNLWKEAIKHPLLAMMALLAAILMALCQEDITVHPEDFEN